MGPTVNYTKKRLVHKCKHYTYLVFEVKISQCSVVHEMQCKKLFQLPEVNLVSLHGMDLHVRILGNYTSTWNLNFISAQYLGLYFHFKMLLM